MSMSISSNAPSAASPAPGNRIADRKAFHQLRSDLQSGDVDGAQQAYASLTQNMPAGVVNNPNTAINQLGTALQAGDVNAAQVALGTFGKNVIEFRHSGDTGSPIINPVSTPVTSSTGGSAGTVLNTVA
jgi:hypothetical protein